MYKHYNTVNNTTTTCISCIYAMQFNKKRTCNTMYNGKFISPSISIATTTGEHIIVKIKKRYLFAVIGTLFCIISFSAYQSAKLSNAVAAISQTEEKLDTIQEENKILLEEKETYTKNISNLQEQAKVLEDKVTQLDEVKAEIYEKLDPLGIKAPAENKTEASPQALNTNEVLSVEKTSEHLLSLEQTVNQEAMEFVDIKENVTELLSNLNSIPNILPVNGVLTSHFGNRTDPISGGTRYHNAIDIAVDTGTAVKAVASGTVVTSEYNSGGYGYLVEISHANGLKSLYAHNSSLRVSVGDKVNKGDVIAYSGATGRVTGPHVHYGLFLNDVAVDPFDYINK